jgi:hypothetical protein
MIWGSIGNKGNGQVFALRKELKVNPTFVDV